MSRIIRALDHREPAPQFELASGRVVQAHYLGATGIAALNALDTMPGTPEERLTAFLEVVRLVVPELSREEIDRECSLGDCKTLIQIGKGNTEFYQREIKNGSSGGESPAPPPTPPSDLTT